ncbi:hypothetical protein JCM6882_005850 [Rhodosporidiobolus microsporus]
MSDPSSTASAAPTSPRDDPVLFRLPTELLLDVLSRLSHEDLRKVEQVSRRLYNLVKDKHLDSLLFRQKPLRKLKAGEDVEIHPLMHRVDFVYTWTDQARLLHLSNVEDFDAFDYRVCDDSSRSRLKNNNDVTVREVLEAVGRFWDEPAEDLPEWYSEDDRGTVTHADVLGDCKP